ncbi:flavodoxin family protein [Algoriphagus lacus]|uniref:Flavodoxin family protein n=1 Tax=Algoriphagus lacus TaxID=2056311 RepID=A0A418PNV8_9BACT|nr:NAD(P)H-dependent oxidoreductase [Algoriphagus lacus]RIW13446.1 flavodoxin family protein [Algoriphagus lacus]
MRKIVVINGHPNPDSFNRGLADAYMQAASSSGAIVKEIRIAELDFNPNLQFGYQRRMEWESDLVESWEKIKWADHLVWVHPVWWGGLPALTKGFIDRLFLPGYAFKYRKDSVFWDKLLSGKTARILTSLDQPGWYYWLMYGRPSINQLKKSTLEFSGVKPVKVSTFGVIRNSTSNQRSKWMEEAKALGKKDALKG